MNPKSNKKAIVVFYAIAVGIRYLTNKTDLLTHVDSHFVKIIIQGIGPTVGVIFASLIFKIKFRPMTLTGNYKRALYPVLLYWLLPILLISIHTFFTKGVLSTSTVFACFVYGLCEEIGWRGFLQQQLRELSRFLNVLLVGTLWFIWHLNFEISTVNILFFGLLILGSWGIGVVADKTNSLLAVSAFHSLNNVKTGDNLLLIAIFFVGWISLLIFSLKKRKKSVFRHHSNETA